MGENEERYSVAYIMINRLWHDTQVPLVRVSLVRSRAQARLATIAAFDVAKPRGDHGDVVLAVVTHHGSAAIGEPVYVGASDARALLLEYFDATPKMLDHLLSDSYAERRYDALRRRQVEEPPARY